MTQESSIRVPHAWRPKESWIAPEHAKVAQGMEKDYPRDDWGKRIPGKPRELKVDPRPAIMVPPRFTYKPKAL